MYKARISIVINMKVAYQSSAPVFLCKLLIWNFKKKKWPILFYFSFILPNSKVAARSSRFKTLVVLFSSFLERWERWWRNTSFMFITYEPWNPTDVYCFPRDTWALMVKQLDLKPDFCSGIRTFSSLANSSAFRWVGKKMYSSQINFHIITFYLFIKDFLDGNEKSGLGYKILFCKINKTTYSFIIRFFY